MHSGRKLNSDTFGDPMVCSCSTGLAAQLDLYIRLSRLLVQVVSIKILEILLNLYITLKIKPLINRYSFWIRAAIRGFASPFIFGFALPPTKESSNVWVTLANLAGSPPPNPHTHTGRLHGGKWGWKWSEEVADSSLCLKKSLRGLFWTRWRFKAQHPHHPTPPPAYPATSKTAETCALHQGSGDHWRASYKGGNREECPLISGLQRVRGFQAGGWWFLLWLKEIKNIYLQGFRAGKWPLVASRSLQRETPQIQKVRLTWEHILRVFFSLAQSPSLQIFIKARFSVKALSVAKNIIFTSHLESNDESWLRLGSPERRGGGDEKKMESILATWAIIWPKVYFKWCPHF